MFDQLSPASLLERIALVSAQLHDEVGDREELLRERAQLVEAARRRGIEPFNRCNPQASAAKRLEGHEALPGNQVG